MCTLVTMVDKRRCYGDLLVIKATNGIQLVFQLQANSPFRYEKPWKCEWQDFESFFGPFILECAMIEFLSLFLPEKKKK